MESFLETVTYVDCDRIVSMDGVYTVHDFTFTLHDHLLYFAWANQRVQQFYNYHYYCLKLVVIEL